MGSASPPRTGLKQAACLVCRRGKIKCEYLADQGRCRRCLQLDKECVRPDYHAGRQRGIKKYVARWGRMSRTGALTPSYACRTRLLTFPQQESWYRQGHLSGATGCSPCWQARPREQGR